METSPWGKNIVTFPPKFRKHSVAAAARPFALRFRKSRMWHNPETLQRTPHSGTQTIIQTKSAPQVTIKSNTLVLCSSSNLSFQLNRQRSCSYKIETRVATCYNRCLHHRVWCNKHVSWYFWWWNFSACPMSWADPGGCSCQAQLLCLLHSLPILPVLCQPLSTLISSKSFQELYLRSPRVLHPPSQLFLSILSLTHTFTFTNRNNYILLTTENHAFPGPLIKSHRCPSKLQPKPSLNLILHENSVRGNISISLLARSVAKQKTWEDLGRIGDISSHSALFGYWKPQLGEAIYYFIPHNSLDTDRTTTHFCCKTLLT